MKSRTSLCNAAILKRTLRKGLPLWGTYLLIWLVIFPISFYSAGRWNQFLEIEDQILSLTAYGSHIFGFFYGLASACLVFSWLYKSRSANFFGALPVSRSNLFFTHYLAGLLFAMVPQLLIVLVCLPVGFSWGAAGAMVRDLSVWFSITTLTYLFYYSFAVLLAMIVSNLIALPLLYGILNFTAVVLEVLTRDLMEYCVYGLSSTGSLIFKWLSPFYYFVMDGNGMDVTSVWSASGRTLTAYRLSNWKPVLVLAAVGVAFAAIAFFLHKGRRMESAGDVIAIRHLKPVFLYGFTLGCAVVLGYLLVNVLIPSALGTEHFWGITLCLLAGATLGYFVGQMLLHKSMRVLRREHLLRWGLVCAVIFAAMLCVRLDITGYAAYIPETQEIQRASLGYGGDLSDDPWFIEQVRNFHQDCIDQQEAIEARGADSYNTRTYLSYELADGTLVERQYLIPCEAEQYSSAESLICQYETLYNNPDYKLLRELPRNYEELSIESCQIYSNNIDNSIWLNQQEAREFIATCLAPDLRESQMGNVSWGIGSTYSIDSYPDLWVEICFSPAESLQTEGVNRYYHFFVTWDASRILDYAAQRGVTPSNMEDAP